MTIYFLLALLGLLIFSTWGVDSNGTGGGDWTDDAAWNGTAPGSADNAVILNGDTITKDDALDASDDCQDLTINSGGTLALGTNGIQVDGVITNNGTITGGQGSKVYFDDHTSNAQTGTWDIDASGGTQAEIKGVGGNEYFQAQGGGQGKGGSMNFVNVKFWNLGRIYPQYWSLKDVITDCEFNDISELYAQTSWPPEGVVFRGCTFDNSTSGFRLVAGRVRFEDCQFGASADNARTFYTEADEGGEVICENCLFSDSAFLVRVSTKANWVIRSDAHNQVLGDWRLDMYGGHVLKSTASKKTGDYGVELVPDPTYCSAHTPVQVDFPIPIIAGDVVAPTIYYYGAGTDDLGLSAAPDRLVFELDPGDEWGLNEIEDADDYGDPDGAWVQASFAGGTADGGTEKGTVILRVYLKVGDTDAQVYLADLEY